MAAKEGFRRISTIGHRTAISGALLLLVAFFMLLWILTSPNNLVSLLMWIAMVPGFYLLLIGGLLLVAAWIGEGFADASRDS
jgi:protein-S-isoprenylcysteine O-methyltransferase Ste14